MFYRPRTPEGSGFLLRAERHQAMKRIIALIDGFNIYHSLDENPKFHKYKWLNLKKLIETFMAKNEKLVKVVYFSAYAYWEPEKVKRHQMYVKALATVNVDPILSEFKPKDKKCKICGKGYRSYEEKQTDVQIAISLFQAAIDDIYEKAIIVSGDSDLLPAVKAVKAKFPLKIVHLLFPPNRISESLKKVTDSYSKIKEKHFAGSQFPNDIDLGNGQILTKPSKWI